MSPYGPAPIEMPPNRKASKGGIQVGKDIDERRRAEARRGDGASEEERSGAENAAEILGISYRQTKRMWRRYREQGAKGLVHGSLGGKSNRAKSKKFRDRALRLVREKYSGEVGERFGPTLAAEHLESEDGIDLCQGKVEMSYFRQAAMMGLRPPFPSESIVRNSARRKGFAIAAQEQRALDGSALFERPI